MGGESIYFFWEEINLLLNCNTVSPADVQAEFFDDPGVVWP